MTTTRGIALSCLFLMSVASTVAAGEPCDAPATTILIVRHADRAGQADSLSEAGVARANDLARVALTANVRAIYHSDTRRTRDTAAPLAAALDIQPGQYPAKEITALIERILRDHAGQTVLIVGHSNTVNMIVAAAGGPTIPELDEKEFDGLFVVHVPPCQHTSTLTRLQYGAPSP
jgi:broad specificity phosphatase PhoE